MARPDEQGQNRGADYDYLVSLVEEWERIRSEIKSLNTTDLGQNAEELERLKENRARLVKRIQNHVEDNPRLRGDAINLGFREDFLDERPEGGAGAGDGGNADGQGGASNNSGTSDGDSGGGGGTGGGSGGTGSDNSGNRRTGLPGKAGKDYELVRLPNGQYRVVYTVPVPGTNKRVRFSYAVSNEDIKSGAYGLSANDARSVTQKEMKEFHFFGNADEIVNDPKGRHPFKQFLKNLIEDNEGASWLDSKEVLSLFLQAETEGWTETRFNNRLTQSKWWNKRTEDQRAWERASDADKTKMRQEAAATITNLLETSFGPNVTWQSSIEGAEEKMEKWAQGLASGRLSATALQTKIDAMARKIEGTLAWAEWFGAGKDAADAVNAPEDMFEKIRQEYISWLGPKAKPRNEVLKTWAAELVSGVKSEGDWQKFLRTQSQALHPWLGIDEKWSDAIATYSGIASSLLGQEIGMDDDLLGDVVMKKNDGTPLNQRMSAYDFEQKVRSSDRFWKSRNADLEGQGLVSMLEKTFGLSA